MKLTSTSKCRVQGFQKIAGGGQGLAQWLRVLRKPGSSVPVDPLGDWQSARGKNATVRSEKKYLQGLKMRAKVLQVLDNPKEGS
jgi:hypothetical protein